jgi:hypothetical protein
MSSPCSRLSQTADYIHPQQLVMLFVVSGHSLCHSRSFAMGILFLNGVAITPYSR